MASEPNTSVGSAASQAQEVASSWLRPRPIQSSLLADSRIANNPFWVHQLQLRPPQTLVGRAKQALVPQTYRWLLGFGVVATLISIQQHRSAVGISPAAEAHIRHKFNLPKPGSQ